MTHFFLTAKVVPAEFFFLGWGGAFSLIEDSLQRPVAAYANGAEGCAALRQPLGNGRAIKREQTLGFSA